MSKFERFNGRATRPTLRSKRSRTAKIYRAATKDTHARTRKRKRKTGKKGGGNGNLFILGLIIGGFIFVKNDGISTIGNIVENGLPEMDFSLPEMPTPQADNNTRDTGSGEKIEDALKKFIKTVQAPERQGIEVTSKTRDGEVVKRELVREGRVVNEKPKEREARPQPAQQPQRETAARRSAPNPRTEQASTSAPTRQAEETPHNNTAAQRTSQQDARTMPDTRSESRPAIRREANPVYIYLGKFDEDNGTMELVARKRNLGYEPTVKEALTALLKGPDTEEKAKDIMSCIPAKVYLIDMRHDGSTLTLNFNSAFESNPYGPNGLKVQIYQIIYTATQFPDVHTVNIHINGQAKEVIGGDGTVINRAFTRNNIQDLITVD
jgi:spore germination protein GerM